MKVFKPIDLLNKHLFIVGTPVFLLEQDLGRQGFYGPAL